MEEGSKNGAFKTYDRDGKLILEGSFLGGRLHGENTGYFANGDVQHKFQYKEGLKSGTNIEYYPSGKVKMKEQVAANGIDATVQELGEDGLVKFEKRMRSVRPHGLTVVYFEGSKIPRLKETYENGKLSGVRQSFYPSGKIQKEETYKFNLLTGPVKTYYESGAVESITEYRSNRRQGPYISYHANGKVKEQGEFAADKKHKEWKLFDEGGGLVSATIFKAGVEVKGN